MPELFIIDKDWQNQTGVSTTGTRSKKLFLNTKSGLYYYFKESLYKDSFDGNPAKDYRYEFWSEVIAYEIGTALGFDILRYDVAIDGSVIGCISKSMINADNEELIEGIKYMQWYDPNFSPDDAKSKKKYTFSLIKAAIDNAAMFFSESFLNKMMEMFVFDAIIGNTDRHQENWGAIYEYGSENLPNFKQNVIVTKSIRFAPVYDSGSSLGRELNTDRIEEYLLDRQKLLRYISKGPSEVHWEENKISHFELLKNLLDTPHKEAIINCITRVQQLFSEEKVISIVLNVDNDIPEVFKKYKIPANRKDLIIKLITLRVERLSEFLT